MYSSLKQIFVIGSFFIATFHSTAQTTKDESLSIREYIEQGVPSPDRYWTGDEFVIAAQAISKIQNSKPNSFPLKTSTRSGKLFDKLIASENLSMVRDSSLGATAQMTEFVKIMKGWTILLPMYDDTRVKKQIHGTEIVLLTVFAMDAMHEAIKIGGKANAGSVDTNTLKGFEKMKSGMATFTKGCLATLTESDNYELKDLVVLSENLKLFVQNTSQWYNESTKQELRASINSTIEKCTSPAIRKNLKEINI